MEIEAQYLVKNLFYPISYKDTLKATKKIDFCKWISLNYHYNKKKKKNVLKKKKILNIYRGFSDGSCAQISGGNKQPFSTHYIGRNLKVTSFTKVNCFSSSIVMFNLTILDEVLKKEYKILLVNLQRCFKSAGCILKLLVYRQLDIWTDVLSIAKPKVRKKTRGRIILILVYNYFVQCHDNAVSVMFSRYLQRCVCSMLKNRWTVCFNLA
ncbi:hypothetical protein AGLY_013760 [Aphis glycines]|uniref:Uncharacterized protein n=1 Tax=Aphis glycines TaxID=307491 RepID=A0A6G0T739_APHGL|nr:hypothetical protein AGLY_013760 [Aphis glycines]